MGLFLVFLLIPCFVLYVNLLILLLSGRRSNAKPLHEHCASPVSVVVAARNEEENIRGCLDALAKQDYPNFEVIVVDDRSHDNTAGIVNSFAMPERSLRLIRVSRNDSGLSGKQNALDTGIRESRGEIVFCTDADCRPLAQWISRTAGWLAQGKADFAFGRTRLVAGTSLLHKFQATGLDLLFGIALALHRLGLPGSCMGNNIAFRRDKYMEMGGQKALGYQAAEDFAMMARFRRMGFRIAAVGESLVETLAEVSVITYLRQQLRWLCGGLDRRFLLALFPVVLANGSIWLVPWFPLLGAVWVIMAGLGLAFAFRSTGRPNWPLVFPLLAGFTALSPVLYLISFVKPRTVWKSDIIKTRPQT